MAILIYIAKFIISSALLYGYYHFFLRNKRFHHYNRFYLLAAVLLSLIIPLVNIPVSLFGGGQHPSALIRTLKVINANGWEEPVTIYAQQNQISKWLNIENGVCFVYLAGLATGLLFLLRSLAWIKRLKRKYQYEVVDHLKIYNTGEAGTPFSFFRSIFWDENISFNDKHGQQIFRHEMFHVKERHSADALLMEIICCVCWFNPFFHLIRKEIKAIHEFLADDYAASANNRYEYAELLVARAISQKTIQLTHSFFHNQIKRRINMITQSNLVRHSGYISRIMVLPLLFLLVSAFAVKITGKPVPASISHSANKTITVVVDPGHGGIFPGAHGDNFLEKDITLSISKKIKELSAAYNVNIVLTRSTDQLVGNATDLREDLLNRAKVANDSKADLFISIHVNATPEKAPSRTGFDVYISGRNANVNDKVFASTILTQLRDIYTINEIIQQREIGVQVLDHKPCPGILLECGYITNPKDAAFITDETNQEKVARKILEGIVKYSNTPTQVVTETITAPATTSEITTVNFQDTGKAPLTKVEFEADYPGGSGAWVKYLIKTVHYPPTALKKNLQGTVVVEFIIDTKGKVSDIKAISGPEELKAESIRVIKESGVWVPAKDHGVNVRSYKRQPISYKLS